MMTETTSFSTNISVIISFTEPCNGGTGFTCSSITDCSLIVYGAGQVLPSTLKIVEPDLKYSIVVSLDTTIDYGRLVLTMDKKNVCNDNAGNAFTRTDRSSFIHQFDRREVFVNVKTHIPEKLLQIDDQTRSVQATDNHKNLKVYLYFSKPVINSSMEVLNSLTINEGSLSPIDGDTHGNRRFGFIVEDLADVSIVTVNVNSTTIFSQQGIPVSPVAPVTFLYDSERPSVKLSAYSSRTRERSIQIFIKFIKPVFEFNSSHVSITGGTIQSFHLVSRRNYIVEIRAEDRVISIWIPENATSDVAGNKNLPSNVLQLRHYSVPLISRIVSTIVTALFAITSLVAGILTVSTASLQLAGIFGRSSSSLTSEPTRSLFRTACHIQVFALSRWLPVTLPIEYYEFTRGLQWSIPYFPVPWKSSPSVSPTTNNPYSFMIQKTLHLPSPVFGSPLTSKEYRAFFESQDIIPEAEDTLNRNNLTGWSNFEGSMFWLAAIAGGLIIFHGFLLLIMKLRRKEPEKQKTYGALTLPRFEIFLVILSLPCISEAAAAIIKGGTSSGVLVGVLLLVIVSFLLLALFLFLSVGITLGKLLQYKEVHQVGQEFHWYQELIRVTLGPGKRGQWTWKNQEKSAYLTMFGPLFEDLRGPPKYMLSQISGGNPTKRGDRIIDSDDETEDAEAPFIQKLFGILRIYYTLIESVKRVCLGILAGTYSNSWSSRTPATALLCISAFQLFFLLLKKPFIKKKVQLVEIVSIFSQLGIFLTCYIVSEKELSISRERNVGIFMISLFLFAFLAQISNEWYALYRQTIKLDQSKDKELFVTGLKMVFLGLLLLFIPKRMAKDVSEKLLSSRNSSQDSEPVEVGSLGERQKSSGSTEKPWLKQLREMAKSSFSKDSFGSPTDPSTSRWSGFWKGKGSGSSSTTSSADFKSKPVKLYKDLEAIFASK
ncbi:uncharacterized protein LOC124920397 isoform X2 [Impatiens glandulifera]|uniref:uncharacterized protein LOC124920397 isoform X2 n=1 Tax=Impatiens glandulifera TaxID=253017 RepID=UPI001FB0C814|nr:uncharacterized protein LOC124920397 isoform X2 [Impatiens glandulifera]